MYIYCDIRQSQAQISLCIKHTLDSNEMLGFWPPWVLFRTTSVVCVYSLTLCLGITEVSLFGLLPSTHQKGSVGFTIMTALINWLSTTILCTARSAFWNAVLNMHTGMSHLHASICNKRFTRYKERNTFNLLLSIGLGLAYWVKVSLSLYQENPSLQIHAEICPLNRLNWQKTKAHVLAICVTWQ